MQNKIKPFVKWAGGKGSLLNQLEKFYPSELQNGKIDCYIEPFVGGGAVLIDILQNYKVKETYAFDINLELINSYNVIKNNIDELIANLKLLEREYLCMEKENRKGKRKMKSDKRQKKMQARFHLMKRKTIK